jgi:hypothetical protein
MSRASACLFITALVGGCVYFPDFEHTPSARLPVAEVVNQIRCDMYEFLKDHPPGHATFSLDTDNYATVELSLSTTAFGDVKFSKIDTVRLGARGFLAIGSSAEPFPSAGLKNTHQVITKVTVNISQNPEHLRDKCERGYEYGYGAILSDSPHADRVLINNLRIASWLKRNFENSTRIVHTGAYCNVKAGKGGLSAGQETCSVGLDNATLTTKFQLVGDVSGGMLDFAKLIPVVATPTLQLNADYYHQIQIIFAGNNALDRKKTPLVYAPSDRKRDYYYYDRFDAPKIKPLECTGDPESDAYKQCLKLRDMQRELQRSQKELDRKMRSLEAREQAPAASPGDADTVARQLRSIRDALILNSVR